MAGKVQFPDEATTEGEFARQEDAFRDWVSVDGSTPYAALGRSGVELFPSAIEEEHAEFARFIYENINNGVYRAGFAAKQAVYERACREVFAALDKIDGRLATRRYLFGAKPVEADWRMF